MIYLVLIFIILSPHYTFNQFSVDTDSISVFENESYLEFDINFVDVRNISTAYNPKNDHIYAYDMNSGGVLWEFKPNGFISALDTLIIPEVTKMMPIDVTHSGKDLLLWEQGLGKVFEYHFKDSSLHRTDRTRLRDLMIEHGSVITNDERILALGGYGFWEFRNLLLEFTPENGEWNNIEVTGQKPGLSSYNFLGYVEEDNTLIYISVPISGDDQSINSITRSNLPFFEIHTFDLNTNRWTFRNSIHPSETDLGFLERPRSRATHSLDHTRDRLVFNGRLTIDLQSYDLFRISHPTVEDMWSTNFYYSKKSDRWIVIGRDYDVTKHHLVVKSFPASEAQLTPIEEELSAYIIWLGWFSGGMLSLALVYLGISKWRNQSDEQTASTPKTIRLKKKDEDLSASINGTTIDLSDPILKEFFIVVYDLKKQEKSEILMSEFDNMIFTDQHSQPFRSKIKKKLFRLVNSKFENPFITIDVYPLDKRYKMIVLNLDIVMIQSQNLRIANSESGNAA